jgi:hypothetical protein
MESVMSTQSGSSSTSRGSTSRSAEDLGNVVFLPGLTPESAVGTAAASAEPGRLRRGWRWVRMIVHQIHAGEDDMRAVYGDNPNGRPDAERLAAAAALSNLGNFGGGGSF